MKTIAQPSPPCRKGSTRIPVRLIRVGLLAFAFTAAAQTPTPTPSAPSLLSPTVDATVSQPVTFDWTDVANATSYNIQVADNNSFAAPLAVNQTVTLSQFTTASLPALRLWYRVRGINSAGVAGPFSAARRFTPQAAPAAPRLLPL